MLAVPAAGGDGRGVGFAQPRMLVLAGKAPVGEKIVRADHHHVDAVDGGDLVGLGEASSLSNCTITMVAALSAALASAAGNAR